MTYIKLSAVIVGLVAALIGSGILFHNNVLDAEASPTQQTPTAQLYVNCAPATGVGDIVDCDVLLGGHSGGIAGYEIVLRLGRAYGECVGIGLPDESGNYIDDVGYEEGDHANNCHITAVDLDNGNIWPSGDDFLKLATVKYEATGEGIQMMFIPVDAYQIDALDGSAVYVNTFGNRFSTWTDN